MAELRNALSGQQEHWAGMFAAHSEMFATEPSEAAVAAADAFAEAGIADVLELGAGQGRDTLSFAQRGFRVLALDYAATGVQAIRDAAEAAGMADLVQAEEHDVRRPLPLADASVGACYSHMLFCMAFTTPELRRLAAEVRRVVRPGGLVVYTARTTEDPHYGSGTPHGDDMYEHGGFIVHYFGTDLVNQLADGFELLDIATFTEGELPRRLCRVTMRVPLRA